MYQVISLDQENEIKAIDFDSTDIAVIGLNTISKLLAYNKYPLNRKMAIKNIIVFLKALDNMNFEKKNILSVSSKIISKYLTTRYYKRYMEILKELEIISKVPYHDGTFYSVEEYCMQYRLFNEYVNDELCLVLLNDRSNISYEADEKYNIKFEKTLKRVDVDYKAAVASEIAYYKSNLDPSLNSLRVRLNTLFSLNSRRWIKKGNKVDRVYHSLTNISKVSRKHLHIDGEKFNDVDIKNCQPLLLCYLIKSLGLDIDANYQQDCEIGYVYERFITGPCVAEQRAIVKVDMYKCIYFDFKPEQVIAKSFEQLYPLTYKSLQILNEGEEKLATLLQNIEASIFNTLSVKKSKFYYTLFDSIYFIDIEDCGMIIKQIREKFAILGIKPMLTVNGETENDIEI